MVAMHANATSHLASPFASLRNQFPLLNDVAYFQTGSLAPLADSVRNATVQVLEAEGMSGLAGPNAYAALHEQSERHRARLATFLGVQPPEIGWVTNTTTAIRYAIGSLSWNPGDTLIKTNREHISTRSLEDGLRQWRQAGISELDASGGDDQLLCELEHVLLSQQSPRLLLISHVSCQDGRHLPVAEVVRLAHAHEVPVLVDGAQSLGQFPIDLNELGCDMLVGSAHKWLLGPAGLGFLYVANQGLVSFNSPFGMDPQLMGGSCRPTPHCQPVAVGLELGTPGMAVRAGLAAALDMVDAIGLQQIQYHVAQLVEQFHGELVSLPGVSMLSPIDPAQRSGITSFAIDRGDHARLAAIVSALWEKDRIMAKVQVEHPSIRISIAAFNNEEDVCRLTNALRSELTTSRA